MDTAKSALASKTLWFNVLSGALAVADHVAGIGLLRGDWPLAINIIGNAALRFLTKQPIR